MARLSAPVAVLFAMFLAASAAAAARAAETAAALPPAVHVDAKAAPAATVAPHHADEHPPAHHAEARRAPPRQRLGCISQRGTIAVVQAGRAVPLSAIRTEAERRGNGEIINAELCRHAGRLVYQVSVLGVNGKVEHMSFDAASGRFATAAR